MRIEFGLADPSGFRGFGRFGKAHLGRLAAAASGIEQGKLGGDLDSSAAASVGMRVEHVRADVRIVRCYELASPDLTRAKAFYGRHFGFAFNESMSMGPMGDYCFIAHGDLPMIGAIMQKPKDAPSHGWLFYFGVNSIAVAKRMLEAGGGTLIRGPHEVPGGDWIIVATDPQGACFGIVGPKGD